MSLTLNLGVIEVPYENEGERPPRKLRTKDGRVPAATARQLQREMDGHDRYPDGPTTTVKVANILEAKYGVMEHFVEEYHDPIIAALIHSAEGALEDMYAGAPLRDPFAEAGQEIASGFRFFLASGEIETMGIEGVPTEAAIERRSKRFKSKKGPSRRPSFVDTGLYEASFRAWMES